MGLHERKTFSRRSMKGDCNLKILTASESVAGDSALAELRGEHPAELVESSLRARVRVRFETGDPAPPHVRVSFNSRLEARCISRFT